MDEKINLILRDAKIDDLEALSSMNPKRAIHSDRIRDAESSGVRYIIAERGSILMGHGLLVFRTPEAWPEIQFLPIIIDLYVRPECRSQGIGTSIIHKMEKIAVERGCSEIFISVNPKSNKRAYSLYLRLGYEPLQEKPYMSHWRFTSSDGEVHEGHNWNIDLRKSL